ncbi:hypothetical protein F0562_026770 [Nyssa sinensis]|uniref:Uncharacterized protein n=1 Tax=Nyssa sinensis TaxID=561372 RepID=A0A5J5BBP9_9ASTE|nr:hypothetical protein F0562_026770 [Nyssa sinensis]
MTTKGELLDHSNGEHGHGRIEGDSKRGLGRVPNLNVSAALIAFVFIRTWTKLLKKAGIVSAPFTRQENTIIQTCAVACYSIAVGGGFGSYLLGLNKKTYEQAGLDTEGNSPGQLQGTWDWLDDWFSFCIQFCWAVGFGSSQKDHDNRLQINLS